MCDFASYLFYDHPQEGWKLLSKDLRSHSPSVSALHEMFGQDFDRYAQVESQHESNYADDFQILLGSGLTRKNVTREFVRDKILEIAPTMPDLIENLISGGLIPDAANLSSAMEHDAWKTFEVLAKHVDADSGDIVLALLGSDRFDRELFDRYSAGVEITEDHLYEAIMNGTEETVRVVIERMGGKVSQGSLDDAIDVGDQAVIEVLLEYMKPTVEMLMRAVREEMDETAFTIASKMKRISLSEEEILDVSATYIEEDTRLAIARKLSNKTQRGLALFNFIWDLREVEVQTLIKDGVEMSDQNIITIISESENGEAIELLRKYLLKHKPSKRVLAAVDAEIERAYGYHYEEDLKKLKASVKRKWKV